MGISVHINHEGEIGEWLTLHPSFEFITTMGFPQDSKHKWRTNDQFWNYNDKTTYAQQIMFIGKTGYGKSSTLNRLVGTNAFDTSDIEVCTKDLYTSMYRIDKNIPSFLMISDLPGVGETNYADDHYYEWYKEMFEKSGVVVYVLRADQRDYAVDEHVIKNLFPTNTEKEKLLLAINYADKIEPINRKMGLTTDQIENLSRRLNDVSRLFSVAKEDILYYSAVDGINIDWLERKMADKLKKNFYN